MKLYNSSAIENLAQNYIEKGGEIITIKDGSLLEFGLAVFMGNNLKTAIVKEKYLNEWSSAYVVRMYNKTPKKYLIY